MEGVYEDLVKCLILVFLEWQRNVLKAIEVQSLAKNQLDDFADWRTVFFSEPYFLFNFVNLNYHFTDEFPDLVFVCFTSLFSNAQIDHKLG
jgi:hypothetical protein